MDEYSSDRTLPHHAAVIPPPAIFGPKTHRQNHLDTDAGAVFVPLLARVEVVELVMVFGNA